MRLRRFLRRCSRLKPTSRHPRRVAVYVSSHGFGHAVRAAAVLEALHAVVPVHLTVLATCSRHIWPDALTAVTEAWHAEACDVGVVQSDDVTVDLRATRVALDGWLRDLPSILQRETTRLEVGFDLVLGDVPSIVFEAAYNLGIPAVAVANFSWDWIYAELGLDEVAGAAAAGYAKADLLLETSPFGPMPAFPRRQSVGLVARPASPSRALARHAVGLGDDETAVLLAFQPASAPAVALPPPRAGRVYLVPVEWPRTSSRADLRTLAPGSSFLDALAAADVVIGKPGYGLIGDVEAAGARFLYVPRPGFPENAILEDHLAGRTATLSLDASRLATGDWEEELVNVEAAPRPPLADTGGAARAATAIARLLGIDSDREPD